MQSNALRNLLFLVATTIAAVPAAADPLPAWASQAIAGRDVAWHNDGVATVIFNAHSIQFSPASTSQFQLTVRGVLKVNRTGDLPNLTGEGYNPSVDKILSANAWIIDPDGHVSSFGRNVFVDQVNNLSYAYYDLFRALYFPGAGSGAKDSYIVWEETIQVDKAFGEASMNFQYPVACEHASFEVVPSTGDTLDWHATSPSIPAPVLGSAPGSLVWTVTKAPPRGEDLPDGFSSNPHRVQVRCVVPGQVPLSSSWTQFASFVDGIMTPQIQVTPEVTAAAEEATKGLTQRWEKIRAISQYIQTNISYLAVGLDRDNKVGFRPHVPSEVLKCRFGDCKDKATLMVAMLRAIGEDGRVVLLYAGNPLAVREDWPCSWFNHAIVAIPTEGPVPAYWPTVDAGKLGQVVIFDPTDHATPLGVLSREDQCGFGLVVDSKDGLLIRLPRAKAAVEGLRDEVSASLSSEGDLTVSGSLTATGTQAATLYQLKYYGGAVAYKAYMESLVHKGSPTSQNIAFTDSWLPAKAEYNATVTYVAPNAAHRMSESFMSISPAVLVGERRMSPWRGRLDGKAYIPGESFHEEVTIALPEGYSVEEAPDPISVKDAGVSVDISYRVEAGKLIYSCEVERDGGIYGRDGYEQIRGLYQKLDDAERRPILLRKAA